MRFEHYLLPLLILLPLTGAITLLLLPKRFDEKIRDIAFVISLVEFFISLFLFQYFDASSYLLQLVQKVSWIPSLGISFFVGLDGLSFWLVLLSTFLTPIVILTSNIHYHPRVYLCSFLVLETAIIGTFVAFDLFLFYIFWEMMLIPMYLIIGIWGGPRRIYATMKFLIYTLVGGILMLTGIIFLIYLHHEQFGFFSSSLLDIYSIKLPFNFSFWDVQSLLFLAFALAFLIKIPMFPFHTWLPDAHVEAPTGGSVILAGVLLKMGTYGFLRFAIPLFPDATKFFMPYLISLSLVGVIYGALLALAQKDLKKLVAYSSISHMGLIMLGLLVLNHNGISGSILQMLCHGISTGGLFLMVGMIYERRHTREMSHFGGLASVIPLFSVFLLIISLSSIALPSTNGFVGEFLILMGAFEKNPFFAILGGIPVILGAYYMLHMYQKVAFGPVRHEENKSLLDLSRREIAAILPIILLIFWIGLYPKFFLSKMEKSIDYFLTHQQDYTLGVYDQEK